MRKCVLPALIVVVAGCTEPAAPPVPPVVSVAAPAPETEQNALGVASPGLTETGTTAPAAEEEITTEQNAVVDGDEADEESRSDNPTEPLVFESW